MSEAQTPETSNEETINNTEKNVSVGEIGVEFPPLTDEELLLIAAELEDEGSMNDASVAATALADDTFAGEEEPPSHAESEPGLNAEPPDSEIETEVPGEAVLSGSLAGAAVQVETNTDAIEEGVPPRAESGSTDRNARLLGCLRYLVLVLLTSVMAAALVLAVLVFVNGTIDIRKHDSLILLKSQMGTMLDQLNEQTSLVEEGIMVVSQFEGELETNSEAISTIDDQIQDLDLRMQALEETMQGMVSEKQVEDSETLTQTLPLIMDEVSPSETITETQVLTETQPVAEEGAVEGSATAAETPVGSFGDSPALALFPPLRPIFQPNPGQSHIFGLVWDDTDKNARPTEGEKAIPVVIITLSDAQGNVLGTAVTSTDGRYFFPNLDPGTYIIEERDPAGVESITPNTITVTISADDSIEINFADAY